MPRFSRRLKTRSDNLRRFANYFRLSLMRLEFNSNTDTATEKEIGLAADTPKKDLHALKIVPRNGQVPIILLAIFVVGAVVVIIGGCTKSDYRVIPALLWALGFCVSGMLLGFLFAIPRTLPSGAVVAPTASPSTSNHAVEGAVTDADQERAARSGSHTLPTPGYNEINSNLVEVSDWLTKIIVGVGLVELKDLPANAESVARFISPSLGVDANSAVPIAGGIMLFFSVLGFLIGYLLTRIYLAVIIKWADNMVKIQNEPVRLRSGREIELSALSLLQQDTLSDLQQTVAELASTPQNAESMAKVDAAVTTVAAPSAKRVLWVDDKPENNTLLVEQLIKGGVTVDQALSTQQALRFLAANNYDVVVTDMGRIEGKTYVPDAGVLLARQIQQLTPQLPVLVFTNGTGVKIHGAAARESGIRLVTTSGTRLIAEMNKILKPPAGENGAA
jgi:CheY-like chemotaxis protein